MSTSNRRRRRPVEDDPSDAERPRQRRNRDEALDAEDEDEDEAEGDAEGDSMAADPTPDEQLAKKLIRYAMACDYSRTPIRRDGIKERVLGDQGRAFRRVYDIAQQQLRQIWGMELRELPVREKHTMEERRKAIKSQSQAKASSGNYVLSSTLPPEYRTPAIVTPSKTPSADAEASYAAFYHLVATIIMLNGGELSDPKLRRYLHRLNAEDNVGSDPTEEVLKRMQTQGYVVKQVQRDLGSQTQGGDGADNVVWYVGPRAQEEIGIDGASGLVREVWGPQDGDRETEVLEGKIRASFGLKEPEPGHESEQRAASGAEAVSGETGEGTFATGPTDWDGRTRRSRGRPRQGSEESE